MDRVGVDNYNWGARWHDGVLTHWQSFRSLFRTTINRLRPLTGKPLWISEVGSLNNGGSKATWITSMFSQLKRGPRIAWLMWFDIADATHHAGWRIETGPQAVSAWTEGFRSQGWIKVHAREVTAVSWGSGAVGRQPNTPRLFSSRVKSVCWIVSRTWSVRLKTSIGSSAAPSG